MLMKSGEIWENEKKTVFEQVSERFKWSEIIKLVIPKIIEKYVCDA